MLTAEAEKKVRELTKEAAEKAVLDYSVSQGKMTDTSGSVAKLETEVKELQGEVRSLVRVNETLTTRVTDLEYELKNLQKEVDDLKSDVAVLSK